MKIGRREGKLDLFSMLSLQDISFRATGKVEAALKRLSHGSNESEAIFRIFPRTWLVILTVTLTCRLKFPYEAKQQESLSIIF